MGKREADTQLTKDSTDDHSGGENGTEGFKMASQTALKGRVFAAPRMRKANTANAAPTSVAAPSNPFANVMFVKPTPDAPVVPSFGLGPPSFSGFSGLSDQSIQKPQAFAPAGTNFFLKPTPSATSVDISSKENRPIQDEGMKVDAPDNSRVVKFGRNLKGLNTSLLQHLQKVVAADGFVDLTAFFGEYKSYREKLVSDFQDVKDQLLSSSKNDGLSLKPAPAATEPAPSASPSGFSGFPTFQSSSATVPFVFPPKSTSSLSDTQPPSIFASSFGGSKPEASATEETGDDDGEEGKDEQINPDILMKGAGEDSEDTVFEVKGKANRYNAETKAWADIGVGMIRINKDRGSGKKRLILRADGSGRVLLNFYIANGMSSKIEGKSTVTFFHSQDGKPAKFSLRVKEVSSAENLKGLLAAA
ncbi:hypothetical protein BC829DRAFT_486933 [Chytridium lagenaria]|nr:hypothetical protein BC829DRAFT_486933 [Chytridium lagenaria]